MARADVDGQLCKGVAETEPEAAIGIDALEQVVEIATPGRHDPCATPADEWSFQNKVCARAAHSRAAVESIAIAVASREIDFRPKPAAGPLRIAARHERRRSQGLAVDHGDRAAVRRAVNAVDQIW